MKKLDGTWLVGVSGGPDSMALVDLCMHNGTKIALAHVNYHHRPQADEEEEYIRQYAKEHSLVCHIRNEAFRYEGNFEAAARTWRYAFFVELVKEYGYKGVLIAHQEDDLLETYIMQEEKNIVPSYYGLQEEMMYQGVLVCRPLLSYTKKQLEQYCIDHHVRYYIDATNADETYARNAVRHQQVEPLSPFERKMIRTEIDHLNAEMKERNCRVATYIHSDKVNLMQYRACTLEDRLHLLRLLVEPDDYYPQRISLKYLQEIDAVIIKKDDFMMTVHDHILVSDHFMMFLADPAQEYCDVYASLDELLRAESAYYHCEAGSPGVYAVSLKEEDFPVSIRNVKEGDRIALRFGNKAVHRWFVDRKIPLYQRKTWPVVTNCKGEVILVPGIGCDVSHFTVNPQVNVIK